MGKRGLTSIAAPAGGYNNLSTVILVFKAHLKEYAQGRKHPPVRSTRRKPSSQRATGGDFGRESDFYPYFGIKPALLGKAGRATNAPSD